MAADESTQAVAIRSALDAALAGSSVQWHAYDFDDVPPDLPSNYAVISVTRRFGDDFRFSYGRQLVGYRLTTTEVGQTVDQARWVRARIAGALSDQPITVDGAVTTPFRFESQTAIDTDDGMWSGVTSWTYAL